MSEIIRDVVLIIIAVSTAIGAGLLLGRSRMKLAANADPHRGERHSLRSNGAAVSDRTSSGRPETKTLRLGVRHLRTTLAVGVLGVCSMASMIALAVDGGPQKADDRATTGELAASGQTFAGFELRTNPSDDVARLTSYLANAGSASRIGSRQLRSPADGDAPQMSPIPSLPGVETMIARLAARLQSSPTDAEGWRMLGWSYFHTKRYAKAVAAYERALKLKPGSEDYRSGLSMAKKQMQLMSNKRGAANKPVRPNRDKEPTAKNIDAAEKDVGKRSIGDDWKH